MPKPNIYLSEDELLQIYAALAYCISSTKKHGSCVVSEYLAMSDESFENKKSVEDLSFKIYCEIEDDKRLDQIDDTMSEHEG